MVVIYICRSFDYNEMFIPYPGLCILGREYDV
nr:MAG TPA: HEPATOCYTE GROWTH FACTOR GROWTH FACTOR, SCATTER FACTOR [Caudoviricetes sp.]